MTNLPADGDGNGKIDAGDYDVWKSHFGNGAGSRQLASSAVPEPASICFCCSPPLCYVGRRHRAGPAASVLLPARFAASLSNGASYSS